MYFHLLEMISFWKRLWPSFEQTWIHFTKKYFVPSLNEIGPVVLEKMKMWKVYKQTDGQTDGRTDVRRQVIRKVHLSFQLRWAKKFIVTTQVSQYCQKLEIILHLKELEGSFSLLKCNENDMIREKFMQYLPFEWGKFNLSPFLLI